MSAETLSASDQSWTVPATWRSKVEPFRGRSGASAKLKPQAAQAVQAVLTDSPMLLGAALPHPLSHAALAGRGAEYLGAPAASTDPLGAAVCLAIGSYPRVPSETREWEHTGVLGEPQDLADYLVHTHGYGFAVTVVAALTGIVCQHNDPAVPDNARHSDDWRDKSEHFYVKPSPRAYPDPPLMRRLRALLASAGDADYAEAVAAAARLRVRGGLPIRLLTSFLLPTQQDWVAADLTDDALAKGSRRAVWLLASVTRPDHAARVLDLLDHNNGDVLNKNRELLYSLAAHLGPEAVPALTRLTRVWFAGADRITDDFLARILAHLPDDLAFETILNNCWNKGSTAALLAAADRFPRRALRILGSGEQRLQHRDEFEAHVRRHPDLTAELAETLPEPARLVVAEILAATRSDPAAEADIPAILLDPPWNRPRSKETVIAGLRPPAGVDISWRAGERERWLEVLRKQLDVRRATAHPLQFVLETIAEKQTISGYQLVVLAAAATEVVEPVLRECRVTWMWSDDSLFPLMAAHGVVTHDLVVDRMRTDAGDHANSIAPFESPEAAELAAAWLSLVTRRKVALEWLGRHPGYAARAFLPGALGSDRKIRRTHTAALRALAALGHTDEITTAAAEYGVTAAVAELLGADPAMVVPARIPAFPRWLSLSALPSLRLRAGGALPDPAVTNLLTLAMLSDPGAPHASLLLVRAACEPESLGRFVLAVHEEWRHAGGPARDNWIWELVACCGGDTCIDMLAQRVYANEGRDRALNTLVAIGTPNALLGLRDLSERAEKTSVRESARARITEVAEGLGLTADQLADRLVPDLGLRPDGTALLDFGPRQFLVDFDEQLRPVLTREDGSPVKALPRAGKRDDAHKAAAATGTYRQLRKDVKRFAADQIRRLERAMVTERTYSPAELRADYIEHPLRRHLTRRLVWAVVRDREVDVSFRIAEDDTFADAQDDVLTIAEDAVLAIAHPVRLGPELTAAWSEVLADYELLQPFPQVGRDVYEIDEALLDESRLEQAIGLEIPIGRLFGLAGRGWGPMERGSGGTIDNFDKPLGDGRSFSLSVDPGFEPYATPPPLHTLRWNHLLGPAQVTFRDLGQVTRSEILRDLAWLGAPRG
ncbi:DUF4132 domain-containing protein [Nocardia sp. NPDC127579]|uniref:DUF4132 domain-containing protein n=1 Tax=Nocardia sp. NPDC127579 TaxID=3345402 RepID=UPI00362F6B20